MTIKTTKLSMMLRLIGRKTGATTEQLQKAMSWQPHSVRSGLTGLRKKGHGIQRRINAKGIGVYHLVREA